MPILLTASNKIVMGRQQCCAQLLLGIALTCDGWHLREENITCICIVGCYQEDTPPSVRQPKACRCDTSIHIGCMLGRCSASKALCCCSCSSCASCSSIQHTRTSSHVVSPQRWNAARQAQPAGGCMPSHACQCFPGYLSSCTPAVLMIRCAQLA